MGRWVTWNNERGVPLSRVLPLLMLLSSPVSLAGEVQSARPDDDWWRGEVTRYGLELERSAASSHWAAVERAYLALMKLEAPVTGEQHMLGVEAARQTGDLNKARARLRIAIATEEVPRAIDLLKSLDMTYGHVHLTRHRKRTRFFIETQPFAPEAVRAVTYAREVLRRDGVFDGRLPPGRYLFGGQCFSVAAGGSYAAYIDSGGRARWADCP